MVDSDNILNQQNKSNQLNSQSVHLTYFPSAQPLILNLTVNQKMRDLQNLTNLGLAIRGREKLRVRQPLRSASVTIDLDDSARAMLAEELNVKEVYTILEVTGYVTITYSPDAKQIGATERKQWMKTIIADAKAGKGILLEDGSLQIDCPEAPEGKIILTSEEFETIYTPKEGKALAFAGSAGYLIGLDTTLDEALTFEGYARDLIRAIQDARKEMGFLVTDRLQLSLSSENMILLGILKAHKTLIEAETLCMLNETVSAEEKIIDLDDELCITLRIDR
jgi:isoleucyl-tRNA synthetase